MLIKKESLKIIDRTAVIIAVIGVCAISIRALTNSDIWLWLRVGKLISETGNFPQTDTLSHTAYGREWIVHGWGFGVLVYQIYKTAGEWGLTALRLIISLAVAITLIKRAELLKSRFQFSALTVLIGFLIISPAWMLRPHLLGNLYICLLLLILALYKKGRKNAVFFIPILTLLWANTHASLPIAFILILTFIGSELLENLLRKSNSLKIDPPASECKLAIITALSFLTSFINPYNIKIYKYFFKIGSTVKQNVLEWLPLAAFFTWETSQYFLIFLAVYSLILIITAVLDSKQVSYFEIVLTLISFYLSLSALRHIVIAFIILVPFLAKNITILFHKFLKTKSARKLTALITTTILLLLTYKPLVGLLEGSIGVSRNIISTESLQFVKDNAPKGKVYNHFNFGSTILWELPQYKTFIDGRVDMFVPDIYQEWLAVAQQNKGWENVLQKYDVGWIIFPTSKITPGLEQKVNSGNWCLVFWDDSASIILNKEKNSELCSTFAYPPQVLLSSPPETPLLTDLKIAYKRAIRSSSLNATAHNRLGMLYTETGEKEKAEREFRTAIRNLPQYTFPYINLAALYQKENPQKSIRILKEAIRKNPKSPEPYQTLAYLYKERLGDTATAGKYLKIYKKLKK